MMKNKIKTDLLSEQVIISIKVELLVTRSYDDSL